MAVTAPGDAEEATGPAPGVLNMRPVVEGVAYRSSAPFGWDAARVLRFLAEHGIDAVVDLRSPTESALVPWLLDHGGRGGLPELVSAPLDPTEGRPSGTRPLETPSDLADLYLWWTRERPDAVVRAVTPIADGRTTLLHCAAGKDRTGVLSAVVHLAAGTPREEIVRDYAHTAVELPSVLLALRDVYLRSHPEAARRAFAAANPPVILTAPAAAMETFLERFLRRHGSAEAYLRAAGMAGASVERLAERLRAGARQ
ncbi:MAG: tyrosine-protein phosphatase [Arthrobacter sp.]|uniref:tyrosine-protein phosphatase n=1 Tax=Arthrobacter sp. TaxID=1667 RepID=UPI00348C9699